MTGRAFTGTAATALACVALLGGGMLPAAAGGLLSGPDIKRTVTGKRIYLSVPLGGELPLHYRADGRVDGSGEAVGLGKYLKPSDTGTWWVKGTSLCQKWASWYDGKPFCFTLEKVGTNKLRWVRQDGKTGTARIGS